MKGLYLAFGYNFDESLLKRDIPNGLSRKVYYQIETFKMAGFDMSFYNPYSNRNKFLYKIERRLPFAYLHKWDFDYTKLNNFDFIYIRKPWYMDGDVILFLKRAKEINPKIKILLEIPTYPYDNELTGIKSLPLLIKDRKWREYLNNYIDRIVTYSNDETIFDIKTIRVSNAISYIDAKRRHLMCDIDYNDIEFMACSRLAYWHGYDRAIQGLYNYYKDTKNDKYNIILNIVGEGEELDKYKSLVNKLGLNEHVVFHGYLYGNKLDDVYDKCILAFDSLGRHRSKVFYNSSLKGKEYLAKGLIVISGVETELDKDSNYKYYFRVPADETPVDYNSIIDFCMNLFSKESINTIQKEIMNYAEDHFDYSVVMSDIIDFINN